MKRIIKKVKNLRNVKVNWYQVLLVLFIIGLVFLSYNYVGKMDTTESTLTKTQAISIFGWEIDFESTSLFVASIVIGLLDGFNPCAMWVLIYLISLGNAIEDRRKMFAIIGVFVLTEAIMYFILLAGWLKAMTFIGTFTDWFMYAVGAFAVYMGIMSVYSYYKSGGEVHCEVGDAQSKKKTMKKMDEIIHSPLNIATLVAVVVLAVAVNATEFLCSAGLPAIFAQMLAVADVSTFMKYVYISLYDLFFMIDDFIVFGLAIWALNSDWMSKYSAYSKLIGGIVMVGIGIMLLFFP